MKGSKVIATYIIANCSGECKIGITSANVARRLAAIQKDSSPTMNPSGEPLQLVHDVPHDLEVAMHEAFRKHRSRGEWFRVTAERASERLRKYARLIEHGASNQEGRLELARRVNCHAGRRYALRAPAEWLRSRLEADYDRPVYGDWRDDDGYDRTEPNYARVEQIWSRRLSDAGFRARLREPGYSDCGHYSAVEEEYRNSVRLHAATAGRTWTFVVENSVGNCRIGSTMRSVERKVGEMESDRYINPGLLPLRLVAAIPYDVAKKAHQDFLSAHIHRKDAVRLSGGIDFAYSENPTYWYYSGDPQYWSRSGWYDIRADRAIEQLHSYETFIESGHPHDAEREHRRRLLWDEAHLQQQCLELRDHIKCRIADAADERRSPYACVGSQRSMPRRLAGKSVDYSLVDRIVDDHLKRNGFQRRLLRERADSIALIGTVERSYWLAVASDAKAGFAG